MVLPAALTRLFSFTGFAQGLGNGIFAGTELDTDLDQTNNAVNDVVALLRTVVRSDGKLANGSVTRQALAADIALGLGASRPWVSTTGYATNDTVTRGYGLYVAIAPSTGVIPGTNASLWALQADLSQAVVIAPGSIDSDSFADKTVTEPKIADGAASSRVIAAKAVNRSHAATNLGVLPVGAETDYAGIQLPAGFLWCAGQAVSRTTYADLFQAITLGFTATTINGQVALANVSVPITGLGLIGAVLEGLGVPAGTTLVTDAAGNVTVSNPLTTTGSGAYRLFPFGRGDGATTFNVPDRRDRVTLGRGTMGGTAAGRLTNVMASNGLGYVLDVATVQLTNSNLPVNLPGGAKVTVSYPAHGYTTNGAVVNIANGSGNIFQNIMIQPTAGSTSPPQPQEFNVSGLQNPGGGQSFATLQPSGISNKIIFAGV